MPNKWRGIHVLIDISFFSCRDTIIKTDTTAITTAMAKVDFWVAVPEVALDLVVA
jgi:hypothetical protein